MRITENRMIEQSIANTMKAHERAAKAGEELSTGRAVDRPSEDAASWATAKRAHIRQLGSESRGEGIGRARERLGETERTMTEIGNSLARLRELSVQGANDTYGPNERAAMALEARQLQGYILGAANARGTDGEYLLAGSRSDAPPFDPTGAYLGDGSTRTLETSESANQRATLSGSVLTAASGIDIFARIEAFAIALEANDAAALQTAVGDIDNAVKQVAHARTEIGSLDAALRDADAARDGLEHSLAETISRAVDVDPFAAASELARSAQALETAKGVATRIIDLVRPSR